MPKIVISYRRRDSQAITGRIVDKLARHYGDESIFFDIDSTPYGVDFREYFDSIMVESQVLLAVIGPKWVGPRRRKQPRLADANDRVRIEIESAFRCGVKVIPILVDRALMPTESQLPESLQKLAYLHAPSIDSGADFHSQMDRFIRRMDRFLDPSVRDEESPDESGDAVSAEHLEPGGGSAEPAAILRRIRSPDTVDQLSAPVSQRDMDVTDGPQPVGLLQDRFGLVPETTDLVPRASAVAVEEPGIGRPLRDSPAGSLDIGTVQDAAVSESAPRAGPVVTAIAWLKPRRRGLVVAAGVLAACFVLVWEPWRQPVVAPPGSFEVQATRTPTQTTRGVSQVATRGPGDQTKSAPMGGTPGRYALVIGNANYRNADAPLKHTVANARAFASELQRYGFDVQREENLTREASTAAIQRLYARVTPDSAVVLFFSGIGLQVQRRTFLLPIDAAIWKESDIAGQGLDIEMVLTELQTRGAAIKVAILDASRRNPFAWKGVMKGLALVSTPRGTIVLSAASPETVVDDADGEGNLFMRQLLEEMKAPNATVGQIFDRTRKGVIAASASKQIPWLSNTIAEDIPLVPVQGSDAAR